MFSSFGDVLKVFTDFLIANPLIMVLFVASSVIRIVINTAHSFTKPFNKYDRSNNDVFDEL